MKRFAMVLVGCICAQLIGMGGALAAADEKGEYICALSGEQIITSPQQVDGYVTRVSGIVDIKEDGFAVYYSAQDYEYETKENAIWFPEREDYPLKKFLEDNPEIKQGEILGSLSGLFGVINEQKENGYAATATYLNLDELSNDNAYKRAKKEHLKPGQRYDREEEKKEAAFTEENPINNIERKKKRWHFFCKENKKRGIQDNNNEFIETYLAEDTFNDAQKEFLIQCLEEGDSVQEMKTYASASLTPAMMQRLRQVRKKRRERP